MTGISTQAGRFVEVKVREDGSRRQCLLGCREHCIGVGSPNELIFSAQQWAQRCEDLASAAVLAESWLARPKKARRSVRLVGIGKSVIASVMDLSIE